MWGHGRKARMAITTLSVRRCKWCGSRLIRRVFKVQGGMFICRDCSSEPRPRRRAKSWDTISA
jgi:formylmethanofuran dehydrogenase subunit E